MGALPLVRFRLQTADGSRCARRGDSQRQRGDGGASAARRLGDERLLGFWRRVLAYAAREQSRQAWWDAVVSEEAVA